MYIILDIETTGLIPKDGSNNFYSYKILDKYEQCRMLQICYEILDSNLNVMTTKSFYINEIDNITNSHIHGITLDTLQSYGIKMDKFVEQFKIDISNCKTIIAHNLQFDYSILMSELYRYQYTDVIDIINNMTRKCSMRLTKGIFGKFPKLIDLYNYSHNKNYSSLAGAHNAINDVKYLRESLILLKNKMDIF